MRNFQSRITCQSRQIWNSIKFYLLSQNIWYVLRFLHCLISTFSISDVQDSTKQKHENAEGLPCPKQHDIQRLRRFFVCLSNLSKHKISKFVWITECHEFIQLMFIRWLEVTNQNHHMKLNFEKCLLRKLFELWDESWHLMEFWSHTKVYSVVECINYGFNNSLIIPRLTHSPAAHFGVR